MQLVFATRLCTYTEERTAPGGSSNWLVDWRYFNADHPRLFLYRLTASEGRLLSQNILFSCLADIENLLKFLSFASPPPIPEICGMLGSYLAPPLDVCSVGNLIRFFRVKDHPHIEPSLMRSFPHILQRIGDLQLDVFY